MLIHLYLLTLLTGIQYILLNAGANRASIVGQQCCSVCASLQDGGDA